MTLFVNKDQKMQLRYILDIVCETSVKVWERIKTTRWTDGSDLSYVYKNDFLEPSLESVG